MAVSLKQPGSFPLLVLKDYDFLLFIFSRRYLEQRSDPLQSDQDFYSFKIQTMRTFIILSSVFLFFGCQRDSHENRLVPQNENAIEQSKGFIDDASANRGPAVCNPNAYTITLESKTLVNGNWEWIWSVQNPNPGNGSNGTAQNLSHWGMQLGTCVPWSSVVGAAYSGNGIGWITFTPSYHTDPSQNCMTTPVLKFDFGTSGGAKSYYKLIVNQDFPPAWVPGYYKSGANTGCCIFNFDGIGCPGNEEE